MSFQAYLDTIKTKTSLDPEGLRRVAAEQDWTEGGVLKATTKAGAVIAWRKDTYGLGHGHSMAVFALLKGRKEEGDA
jgi:Domain of unknown function (DUF4287)